MSATRGTRWHASTASEKTLTKRFCEPRRTSPLQLAGFNHRKNIPGRIFEPGNRGTIPAHDPFLVCLEVRQIINLKTHAALCEFIDRVIDIIHREIKNGERARSVIQLR